MRERTALTIAVLATVGGAALRFYRLTDATIVPSLCYETFGVVVAESYSASTPVIVYAQSSVEEIVDTHGGGLKYRTEAELRTAIAQLRDDASLRERLGHEGRVAYEAEFAQDAFLLHYLAVVRELLYRKQTCGPIVQDVDEGTSTLSGRPVLIV